MGVWNITSAAGVSFGSSGGASVTASDSAPSNPSEGDLWFNSTLLETYVYYNSVWVLSNPSGSGGGGSSITVSDTAPATPSAGDLWFDSTDLTTYVYYNDGSSSQWVSSMPSGVSAASSEDSSSGSGVTTYADITARDAATPSQGDLAFVTSVTALYVYDGSEWDRIWSGADEIPTWTTELPTNTLLAKDGTPTTLTVLATDPEGFDMTYTYDTSPSSQTQATIVNNNDGTFTLTPSTTLSDAGEFTFRAKATDGVSVISTTTSTRLAFSEDITFSSAELGIATDSTNSISFSRTTLDSNSGASRSSVLQDGRYYFELELTSGTTNALVGVARSDAVNVGFTLAGQPSIYFDNGNQYPGNWWTGSSFGQFDNGDVLRIAYDNTTDEVWFNKNNGTWYPNDPSTGAGIEIGGTSGGTITMFVANGSSGGSSFTADIKTAGTGFNYTVPTGFDGH